jgi:hypothetical protein
VSWRGIQGVVVLAGAIFSHTAWAQIPVEVFVGHQRTTLDILFFSYFKNHEKQPTPWLFFNRNRAGVDYLMTTEERLPQMGFTEAISYNPATWKGFAPVAVVQIFNSGVYPKAGFQYTHIKGKWTVFSWLVSEIQSQPNLDLFGLVRYTPPITQELDGFIQIESLNTLPTHPDTKGFNLVQRLRLGFQWGYFQWGMGADFAQTGPNLSIQSYNLGVFTRYVFKS